MKTRNLLKLALITSLIGSFLIIILAETLEPKTIAISSINEKMIDHWVKIQGEVINQQNISSLTILTINDNTASIRVVLFQKLDEKIISKNVIVTGKIIEYNNELEIQVDTIKFL